MRVFHYVLERNGVFFLYCKPRVLSHLSEYLPADYAIILTLKLTGSKSQALFSIFDAQGLEQLVVNVGGNSRIGVVGNNGEISKHRFDMSILGDGG